jgi:hypothetical protein
MVLSLVSGTGRGCDDSNLCLVEEGWDRPIFCLVWRYQKWDHPLTHELHLSFFFLFFLPSLKFSDPTPYRNFPPKLVPSMLARTYAHRVRCSPVATPARPLLAPRRRGAAARSSSSRLLEARPRQQVAIRPLRPRAGALPLRSPAGAPRQLLFFLSLACSSSRLTFARPRSLDLRGRDV